MADIKIDDTVDITDVVCPVTFVKAKVALEELEDGEVLAVKMNDGEPVQNVPRSIKEEGHQILNQLHESMARAQQRLIAPLNQKDQQTFLRLLTKLVHANNHYGRAAADL